MGMRSWRFKNGIEVREEESDRDLHALSVWDAREGEPRKLGMVHPADAKDMERCMAALDGGEDPVSGGWDDGGGNPCTWKGWGA